MDASEGRATDTPSRVAPVIDASGLLPHGGGAERVELVVSPVALSRTVAAIWTVVGSASFGLLAAWVVANEWVVRHSPSGLTMKANAALAVLLLIAGLAARQPRPRSIAGGLAGILGVAALVEYLAGWSFGIDELLAGDPAGGSAPGRMAPSTAVCVALLGLVLVVFDSTYTRTRRLRTGALSLVMVIATTGLFGFGLGSSPLLRLEPWTPMALPTAVILGLVTIGVVLSSRPAPLLLHQSVAGAMLRRVLVPASIVPFAAAWVTLLGYDAGSFGTRFAMALVTTATTTLLAIVLLSTAVTADRMDRARRKADDEIHLLEEEQARIATTQASEQRFRDSVDMLPDSVSVFVAVRDDTGTILDFRWAYANAASAAVTGFDRAELEGHTLLEVLPHHGPSGLFDEYREVVETGVSYVETTLWFSDVWGDGRERRRAFDVRANKLDDGFIIVTRDVTAERLADAELAERGRELERANGEIRHLGELGDLLQACASPEDAFTVAAQFGHLLFPDRAGAASLIKPSRDIAMPVLTWGSGAERWGLFAPTSCWALRVGRPHISRPDGPRCEHFGPKDLDVYLCVPMLGQGETLGVLHLTQREDASHTGDDDFDTPTVQLATATAVRVALAVSNLRLQEKLLRLSIVDPLTSLYNRRYMEETMTRELARAERDGTPLSVLQMDIDHFKHVNDEHGHDVGDIVLVAMSGVFREFFRGGDVVCRSGGEEFTVLLPGSSVVDAEHRAQSLRERLRSLEVAAGGSVLRAPTISCGVAAFPASGTTTVELL